MQVWMLKGMAVSLSLTLVFELIFAFSFRVRTKREILLVVLVNVLTNPIVVLTFYMAYLYAFLNLIVLTVVMEAGAVITEALLYRRFSQVIRHPWWFSIGANAFSYLMGEAINRL